MNIDFESVCNNIDDLAKAVAPTINLHLARKWINTDLGNVGDSNTLVWLFCDLHSHGKHLIRRGWRRGLPTDKQPVWVFCPLLREKYPRDRKLVEECEKCSHYKGVSHSLKRTEVPHSTHWKSAMIKPEKKERKKRFTKESMEKATQESELEDEKWLQEEKELERDPDKV